MVQRVENEPSRWMWEQRKELAYYSERRAMMNRNIDFKEPIYTRIDDRAAKGIRRVVKSSGVKAASLEKVERIDDHTIELVYYGDDSTELKGRYVEKIQRLVHDFFGPLWRVERKRDARRSRNTEYQVDGGFSIQRLIVRRMVGRKFKYSDESQTQYELIANGTPRGVPDDARRWSDVDHIGHRPDGIARNVDYYVYESSSGTQHLVEASNYPRTNGLRGTSVSSGFSCLCGVSLSAEDIADEDTLTHLSEYVKEEPYADEHHPKAILGDALCGSCWNTLAIVKRDDDGKIKERKAPTHDRGHLLNVGDDE